MVTRVASIHLDVARSCRLEILCNHAPSQAKIYVKIAQLYLEASDPVRLSAGRPHSRCDPPRPPHPPRTHSHSTFPTQGGARKACFFVLYAEKVLADGYVNRAAAIIHNCTDEEETGPSLLSPFSMAPPSEGPFVKSERFGSIRSEPNRRLSLSQPLLDASTSMLFVAFP